MKATLAKLNGNPVFKKYSRIAVAIFVLVAIVSVFSTNTTETKSNAKTVKSVFTDRRTREVGISNIATNQKLAKRAVEDLRRDMTRMKQELILAKEKTVTEETITNELGGFRREISVLNKNNKDLAEKLRRMQMKLEAAKTKNAISGERHSSVYTRKAQAATAFSGSNDKQVAEAQEEYDARELGDKIFNAQPATIVPGKVEQAKKPLTIASFSTPEPAPAKIDEEAEREVFFMPAGSIIAGVFLNGLDAPTGNQARTNPFPVTIRIQHEAILPNRYTADIRECFVIVSGYGDLSSERFLGRTEALSCISDDGDAIETSIQGYVVGNDGKAGMRGRLVSKQGALIARSMVAGFMGGAAASLDQATVPSININDSDDNGTTVFDSINSSELWQGAASKGASNAMERVADFYIDMAENIFPVIEIDAGRQVEIIIVKGAQLKTKNSVTKNASVNSSSNQQDGKSS